MKNFEMNCPVEERRPFNRSSIRRLLDAPAS